MEDRCKQCVFDGSGAVICSTMALRNALEELYGSIPIVRELYKPRECSLFEANEEECEEKICEDGRSEV